VGHNVLPLGGLGPISLFLMSYLPTLLMGHKLHLLLYFSLYTPVEELLGELAGKA